MQLFFYVNIDILNKFLLFNYRIITNILFLYLVFKDLFSEKKN